jgi:uncharacterized iron-regulated protein
VPLMRWMIALCLFCLGAAAGWASESSWGTWAEEVRKRHPLAGSFYFPRGRVAVIGFSGTVHEEFDTEGLLFQPLPPNGRVLLPPLPGILLLGEVHDNPMHHQIRAWLIGSGNWRGAVVFEQIQSNQQPALDQFKALAEAATADEFFRLLEWDKSGWPPASIYRPLFEAVVAARLPIIAGDLPRDRVRAVARGGSVTPDERARLRLDNPMPASLAEALKRELSDGHCGVMPPEAMGGMAVAQRYRDAHMADALVGAAAHHGSAVLIAGNGHVRADRGVPWHIRARAPETLVMSVLLLEVEEGKTKPADYVPRDPEGWPAADLVIFTPGVERGDPCEKIRKMKR